MKHVLAAAAALMLAGAAYASPVLSTDFSGATSPTDYANADGSFASLAVTGTTAASSNINRTNDPADYFLALFSNSTATFGMADAGTGRLLVSFWVSLGSPTSPPRPSQNVTVTSGSASRTVAVSTPINSINPGPGKGQLVTLELISDDVSSFAITAGAGGYLRIDDVAGEVPEPETLALAVPALLGMAALRRRRARATSR